MAKINIVLCVVVGLTFLDLTVARTPILDTSEIECNYTSETAQWRKSCNWCRCSETNRGLCTRRGCPPGLEIRLREEKDCRGDAQWKRDCNWCSCHEERAICTSKYCGELPQREIQIERRVLAKSLVKSPTCVSVSENGSYKDGCNWCRCLNGTEICTKKLCAPHAEEKSAPTSDCNGEIVWKRGCEQCECVDGFSLCTPEECPSQNKDFQCIASEGSRWRRDCNWCTCGKGHPLCTRKGCRPGDLLRDDPICEGDVIWKDDCNWCRCIEGQAKCSKHKCGPDRKNDAQCEDGQTWVDGCNNCFCNQRTAFCTRRACSFAAPLNEIQPAVLGKRAAEVSELAASSNHVFGACKQGSRWMRNCNWCSCANETAVCTLRACLPGYEDKLKPPFCDEDSQWRDDCNICSCANGVQICTKRGCRIPIVIESNVPLAPGALSRDEAQDNMDCTEGSRWIKDNCNWCSCSNGHAACTLKACLFPGFRKEGPVCDDGSQWRDRDGSWCTCEQGKAVCQEESIAKREHMPANTDAECTEGSSWRIACNWCFCSNARGICPLKACIPGFKDDGPDCEQGSEWRGPDCSWCHCEGGHSVCLPSTCPPAGLAEPSIRMNPTISVLSRITPQQKREPSCTDESRWTRLCNWCTCSNGIGLCEQRACLSDAAREMDKSCEGGSRWKIDDCNWCTCVDGKGTCTNDDCTTQGTSVSNDPASIDEEKCISGNSWLKDCNICICANSTAVCTKRACSTQRNKINQCLREDHWQDECNSCRCINGEGACTKKLCPKVRDDIQLTSFCNLPPIHPDAKLCGGFETKWTYNAAKGKCEDVLYGGCGGTENLFTNEQECQTACGSHEPDLKIANLSNDPKEICSLPVVPGPCFALKVRFAFFPERNRCEKFFYGGCQGNKNNFESVDECYNVCGGSPPALDPGCDRSKCDWKRYGHYLGQDCVPTYEGESCCPSRFECKSEEERGKLPDKCYYKGREYQLTEDVPVENECQASCKCLDRGSEGLAVVTCASVECPSLFRRPNPGCRLLYTPGQCCETDRECVDPEAIPSQRSSDCNWKNESWRLGDKMFFSDEPCKSCICTTDFTDPDGPGCKRINCGFDYQYRTKYLQGCVPLYFEERCCPIDWICPGDRRLEGAVIQPSPTSDPAADSSEVCTLGDIVVPVGGSAELGDCQIRCDCKTPPGLTCVKYRSCELVDEIQLHQQQLQRQNLQIEDISVTITRFTCEEPVCPPACRNPVFELDESIGCYVCKCECRKDFTGRPPCPQDCAVRIIFDKDTGCDKCVCDRTSSANPVITQ